MRSTHVVEEVPFWLEVNSRRRRLWLCSPGEYEELATGFLRTHGYITALHEIAALRVHLEPIGCAGVTVDIPEENVVRVAREQRHMREHGCGPRCFLHCGMPLPAVGGAVLPLTQIPDRLRELFAAVDARFPGGGVHGAAIVDGQVLRQCVADTGRHNAIDRAFGAALRAGGGIEGIGMVTTARISAGMALSCIRGGASWLASRSAATTLALQLAAVSGLTIVTRAGGAQAMRHDP